LADQVTSLSVDDIIGLHDEALTLGNGGSEGIRSYQQLAASALQPYQSVFGEDAYPTVAEKAAAHAFFIAEGQPFLDGNKRTAALAMTVFLDLNDYELHEANDTELADRLIAVGADEIDQDEFFGWVCNHARPKSTGMC
jgi:death on curing protein